MKILYIILGVLLLVFLAIQFFAFNSQKNIETYSYVVDKKYEVFEIRSYEATLFTSVKLATKGFKNSSSKGFSILAGYIFGGNEKNMKIPMTSPVTMTLEDSVTMMFMVPKVLKKEALPKPNEPLIAFKSEPKKTVAAITFGGWADDKKIASFKQKLKNALDDEKIECTDRFYFFGYNAPYEVFNRKNEIVVELREEKKNF